MKDTLQKKLEQEVVGRLEDGIGYVVAVTNVHDDSKSKGRIEPLTGFVRFELEYSAVMFRPFKNEVLDVVVTSVIDTGFFAQAGPQEMFVFHTVRDSSEVYPAAICD